MIMNNIIETIKDLINSDYDSNTVKDSKRIQLKFEQMNDHEKSLINDFCISLCGYSLDTIINEKI